MADNSLTPFLVQEIDEDGDGEIETRREFRPNVVTRLGGTLPFESESMQLQCGETVGSSNGDMNNRLVMECIATHTEFQTLQQMRQNPEQIKLVSNGYSGPTQFDEIKWDEIPDANGAVVRGEGPNDEPRYVVQLQSKETDDGGLFTG